MDASIRHDLALALGHLEEGSPDQCVALLNRILRKPLPDTLRRLVVMARDEADIGDPQIAEVLLQQAIDCSGK